jgi:hypothetical protein
MSTARHAKVFETTPSRAYTSFEFEAGGLRKAPDLNSLWLCWAAGLLGWFWNWATFRALEETSAFVLSEILIKQLKWTWRHKCKFVINPVKQTLRVSKLMGP